ncbi:GntR family transcriptional regulator [Micromonospora sp. NPDC049891]|uniref:GntR family transcriptional regulator n=1 Tax=Micromonospora sp. NPDC049891 TaxID=3155655 RepID=UPI00340F3076
MIIELDPDSPTPPYEQIRGQIAAMIRSGALPAKTRLPTIRQLAADLGLAVNTVARSYRELEAARLVVTRVRHGTTVAERKPDLSRTEVLATLDTAARAYRAAARELGVSLDEAVHALRQVDRDDTRDGVTRD